GAYSVQAADVDGDGDLDLVGAAFIGNAIAWWENDGATPPAFTKHTVYGASNGACSVQTADVDGDGDVDILGAALFADDIAWWENNGATPPAFTKRIVDDTFDGASSVQAADVDGDGDLDLVGAALTADAIAWWENNGALVPGFTKH